MSNQKADESIGLSSQSLDNTIGFNVKSFGKDVITYGSGQILLLLFGFIQTLIIPKFLSVEGYGYWQEFLLFGSYVGILHFGFVDGLLVRWAGKKIDDVKHEFNVSFKFLFFQQIITILPLITFFYYLNLSYSNIIILLLIYAFFVNISSYFRFALQAVKKFRFLTLVNVIRSLFFVLVIVYLFLFLRISDHVQLIWIMISSFIFSILFFIVYFRRLLRNSKENKHTFLKFGRMNISVGLFVLLGNFSVILFSTIDRLIVNIHFQITDFAIYAFALMVVSVVYTFVMAISQVFFPYLSGMTDNKKNQFQIFFKSILILTWAFVLILFFPFTYFIELYLPKYIDSLPLMAVLLGSAGFGILIKIVHMNYYKAYKKQRTYFIISLGSLIIAFILNVLAVFIVGTLESVAYATLLSFIIWFIINEFVLKKTVEQNIKQIFKSLLVVLLYLFSFLFSLNYVDYYIYQAGIYALMFLLISIIFYRNLSKTLFGFLRRSRI